MKQLKKIAAFLLVFSLVVSTNLCEKEEEVKAATKDISGFQVDTSVYYYTEGERIQVFVKQEFSSWDMGHCGAFIANKLPYVEVGDEIGQVVVQPYYLTSKNAIDGAYYQSVLLRYDTFNQELNNNFVSYPQYITMKVENTYLDLMRDLKIEPEVSAPDMTYTLNGINANVNTSLNSNKQWSLGGGATLGVTATRSWNVKALSISTRRHDNSKAVWEYDYITSTSNKRFNEFCYADDTQYGILSWKTKDDTYVMSTLNIVVM